MDGGSSILTHIARLHKLIVVALNIWATLCVGWQIIRKDAGLLTIGCNVNGCPI